MSSKLNCHQCKRTRFYILYDPHTRNVWAVCDSCDARLARIDPPPTDPQVDPTTTASETRVVEDAGGLEGGGPIIEAAVRRNTTGLRGIAKRIVELDLRLNVLEASK